MMWETECTSSIGTKKLNTKAAAVTVIMTFLRPTLSAYTHETTMKMAKNATEHICMSRYSLWVNFRPLTP